MKQALILYDRVRLARNERFAQLLTEACEKHNASAITATTDRLTCSVTGGKPILLLDGQLFCPDLVLRRCVDDLIACHIEAMGIPMFNSAAVGRLCNDKAKTSLFCAQNDIPVCDSIYFDRSLAELHQPKSYPVVVKSGSGHGGSEVFLAADHDEYLAAVDRCPDGSIVVQPLLDCGRSDIRVYMLGGEVLRAVMRTSESDFRSNFSLGGNAREFKLTTEQTALARRIAALVGGDFIGIDFLPTDNGFVLNEIEDVVGTRMLYALGCCDAAELLVEYALNRI